MNRLTTGKIPAWYAAILICANVLFLAWIVSRLPAFLAPVSQSLQ
jgi:hypothetical protein